MASEKPIFVCRNGSICLKYKQSSPRYSFNIAFIGNSDMFSGNIEERGKREAVKVPSHEAPVKKKPVEAPKVEDEKNEKVVKIKQEKTGTKPVTQELKATENMTVKQEIKTPKEKLTQEAPGQEDGPLHLNQVMTQVLEDELQDLMMEIWETLPDVASSDAERLVTERLRDGASDDLKKILGLNVTKRLLNVFNPLFVKIQFSGRPESGFLNKFLQTYNITSFKRINQESNTFAAKLNTISDFDNICTAKDLRCGSAQLAVTPCYKFTKCPDNLTTMYANKIQYEFGTHNENNDNIKNENKIDVKNISSENDKGDKKEVLDKTKQGEKVTVSKIQIKQKAHENLKPVKTGKKPDKTKENKCQVKEIEYDNEIFEEINEMNPDFNEEMNDDEILALICGGVVVDQCSGSDQE